MHVHFYTLYIHVYVHCMKPALLYYTCATCTCPRNEVESQKVGKGSFAYAWVLDETGEERSR